MYLQQALLGMGREKREEGGGRGERREEREEGEGREERGLEGEEEDREEASRGKRAVLQIQVWEGKEREREV
jgi:hypothetical protein